MPSSRCVDVVLGAFSKRGRSFRRAGGRLLILRLWLIALLAGLLPVSASHAQPLSQAAGEEAALIQAIIDRMSVTQRVGQLFLVTFVGVDTGPNSDIARLVRDWQVGGVVLLAANDNFRNEGDTAGQVLRLTNDLQTFAFRDLNAATVLADGQFNTALEAMPGLPLLIAIDHEGDSYPYTRLINGFTPVPNNLAIGATWNPEMAQQVGGVVGRELEAVGINLLLGPSLDVLDNPRPELQGYPGSRTFGGDAYWVAQMGQAYITGVHQGSSGRVATVAKHFPGQGASDRSPDREVATVQKPLSSLQQVELAPFRAVTVQAAQPEAITDAMMTSHVRYKGFQENPRQLTPPISLAPELQTIMAGFGDWQKAGGLLVSDALGVNALKRYYQAYEPDRFPARRVAQEAFLAGNDLLILSQFDRDGIWSAQLANMEDVMTFFRQKYEEDPAFRTRVDAALARILRLKLKLYSQLSWTTTQRPAEDLPAKLNKGSDLVTQIARSAATLVYPGATELADRLPSAPLAAERVLIFTDARGVGDCPICPVVPAIPVDALEQIALRLYGPAASDQVRADNIDSASFAELDVLLRQGLDPNSVSAAEQITAERFTELNGLINGANWLVFAMLDIDQEARPSSVALRRFLDQRADALRDKKILVFSFNAPYYLSDTEISKLTAYYGLYSKTPPFLETAVRLLFRELSPPGMLPVSVAGVNYNLDRQLEPDPARTFALELLVQADAQSTPESVEPGAANIDLQIGDAILVRAGPVRDRNGHIVPDGTLVEFRFQDQQAGVELPRRQEVTVDGVATTRLTIERPGVLQLLATTGEGATSSPPIILTVGGESGASLAAATPTATPTQAPTPTSTPTPNPTATPEGGTAPAGDGNGSATGVIARGASTGLNLGVFLLALLGNAAAAALHYRLTDGANRAHALVARDLLLSVIGAQGIYAAYGLEWLPGAHWAFAQAGVAAILLLTFLGGLLPFAVDRIRPTTTP